MPFYNVFQLHYFLMLLMSFFLVKHFELPFIERCYKIALPCIWKQLWLQTPRNPFLSPPANVFGWVILNVNITRVNMITPKGSFKSSWCLERILWDVYRVCGPFLPMYQLSLLYKSITNVLKFPDFPFRVSVQLW